MSLWRAFVSGTLTYGTGAPPGGGTYPTLVLPDGGAVPTYEVTSIDANPVTLWSATVPSGAALSVRANILAKNGTGGTYSAELSVKVYRSGVSAPVISGPVTVHRTVTSGGFVGDADFDIFSSSVRLRIFGALGESVEWVAEVATVTAP